MMLLQGALAIAEPMINKAFRYDLSAADKLTKLEQKSLSVHLTDLDVAINVSVLNQQVRLSSNTEHYDCFVKTELSQLRNLADAAQITSLIKADLLELEGSLTIAQQFSGLFVDNDIDWQEWCSKYLGDALTHRLFYHVERSAKSFHKKRQDLDYTVQTLLTEELRVVPSSIELALFSSGVDNVSARTEKLIANIQSLKATK